MGGPMQRPKRQAVEAPSPGEGESVRLSITLSVEQHQYLERVAKRQRVSLAWVVRDAIRRYMDAAAPLFADQDRR